jgi:uncharacterized protein DUF2637
MRRRDSAMEWAAGLMLPVLIALAGVLSNSALRALALTHGYPLWEADAWPLSVDAFALIAMLTAMVSARRAAGPTREAWTLTAVAIAVTVAGNVLSAGTDTVAELMHAWPALPLAAGWHLWTRYVSVTRPDTAHVLAASPAAEPLQPAELIPAAPSLRETRPPRRRSKSAEATRRRVQRLVALNPHVTAGDAARQLKVSRGHAARLLREARRPHVMDQAQ